MYFTDPRGPIASREDFKEIYSHMIFQECYVQEHVFNLPPPIGPG